MGPNFGHFSMKTIKKNVGFCRKNDQISCFGPDVILRNETPLYSQQTLKLGGGTFGKIDEGVVVEFSNLAQMSKSNNLFFTSSATLDHLRTTYHDQFYTFSLSDRRE